MLALYVYTPLSLAEALVIGGKTDEAKPYFDAAIDLAPDPEFAEDIAVSQGDRHWRHPSPDRSQVWRIPRSCVQLC